MTELDYSALDRQDISMNSFYPRAHWTPTPEGAQDHAVTVAEGVSLSCRFFPVGRANPTILFFYGNGETAASYDQIASFYCQIGVNFFIADYRGYGRSGGEPTFTAMLSDAHRVLAYLEEVLAKGGFTGPVYVMGRSMGRHAAFELGANAADKLAASLSKAAGPPWGSFVYGLDPAAAAAMETAYQQKVASIALPALVIHGEMDELAPLQSAVSMFESFPSPEKTAVDHSLGRAQRPAVPGNQRILQHHPRIRRRALVILRKPWAGPAKPPGKEGINDYYRVAAPGRNHRAA